MRNLLVALLILLGLCTPALPQASVFVPATTAQTQIAGTVAASTRIITGIAGKQIYVTALMLTPIATTVVTFTYGTGTNCGTGTQSVTGALTFAAGQELAFGSGYGAIFVLPKGNDLCITIATAAAPGSISYAIF